MAYYLKKCKEYKLGDNQLGDPSSELSLTIAAFNPQLCLFDVRVVTALASGVFSKFNITLQTHPGYFDVKPYMEQNQDVDAVLARWAITKAFAKFAVGQWFKDEYNMVILSALYTKDPNIAIMLNVYALNVWLLVVLSIFIVSIVHYIECKLKDEHKSISVILFETTAQLINQVKKEHKISFLIAIWSLVALLLSNVFSSGILSALMDRETVWVDSMDQLLKTNLKAYVANESYIWWQFKNFDNPNKKLPLVPSLDTLRQTHRIEYVDRENEPTDQKDILQEVSERKYVYMSYLEAIFARKHLNQEFKLEISSEMNFPALITYPVNKNYTKARERLLNVIKIMVESGISAEMEDMNKLNIIMEGKKHYDEYKNRTHIKDEVKSSIKFDLIVVLLITTCSCYAFCSLVLILELIVSKYYNPEIHMKYLHCHKQSNVSHTRRKHSIYIHNSSSSLG